uniref:Uncharacterized protein LOC111110134 isoform X2 n=1 Tax=Crassostrea virginica TaxID=6565 RepID=A0A8B8BFS7_CRAVI|nr:uncharacterized protein LOC111110134 isoform X2 [Crassostrea virginica]
MSPRFVLGFLVAITTFILKADGDLVKTPLKSKADIFRLLLNQETLIRSALEKKVHHLVNDVVDIKEKLVNNKKEILYLKHKNQKFKAVNSKLHDAKTEIAALKNKNDKLQAETRKQLKHAKEEYVALNNKIIGLKANLQYQANVTKMLSAAIGESKNIQIKLSSAVSSFREIFRNNVSLQRRKLGFTVGATNKISWNGSILRFNQVVTNSGHGYSTTTGKFTAPIGGSYVFFVATISDGKKSTLELAIVHNGVKKVMTESNTAAPYQTGSNLVVLKLDKGDCVWVESFHGQNIFYWRVPFTTFSGFLL